MPENRYKCLIFDHDDTVVNSTATIHHPAFVEYLKLYRPGMSCTLDEYMLKNCDPGFIAMCCGEYGMSDEELEQESIFWQDYVSRHVPRAYDGIREIMERQLDCGGHICVISHSFENNIRRDYRENGLPQPELVFGWEQPRERRKPNPWPVEEIMRRLDLQRSDLLMIDDLKPGWDMAQNCGIDFAAARWANDIPQIDSFMLDMCGRIYKTVKELENHLFS